LNVPIVAMAQALGDWEENLSYLISAVLQRLNGSRLEKDALKFVQVKSAGETCVPTLTSSPHAFYFLRCFILMVQKLAIHVQRQPIHAKGLLITL